MIPIPPKRPLRLHAPPLLLLHPLLPTHPRPNTRIPRLLLRTLHGDQLVKILIQRRRLTSTPMRRPRRTMPCNVMLVADIPEKPRLRFRQEHRGRKRVDGRVAETFVVEPAQGVEVLEVFLVGLAAEEVQVADLEVAEELAVVVVACVVEQPVEICVWVEQVGVFEDEVSRLRP